MADANRFKALLLSLVRIMVGVLLGIFILLLLLYIFQDKLIFFPQTLTADEADRIAKRYSHSSQIENISLKSEKGICIRGWFVKNSTLKESALIIYFGGNAEEVSYLIFHTDKIKGWSLALMNYRGYGLSEGKPTEKNLYTDAISIYDYFTKRDDIDKKRIVVMGRSLGTGVATYLAKMRPVKALILVSPYDSLLSVAKEHFPFLPVKLLLRHRFDSLSRAPFISAPLLVLVASEDNIIRISHSKKLAEKWGGEHSLIIVEGEDHNTIYDREIYWKTINEFLVKF
jgi:pimeloyl-ACP methyl ester carboxylesterase